MSIRCLAPGSKLTDCPAGTVTSSSATIREIPSRVTVSCISTDPNCGLLTPVIVIASDVLLCSVR